MERRFFPVESVKHNGVLVHAQVIRCAACGAVDHVAKPPTKAPIPPEGTAGILRRRGWTVGKNPRKDRCPTCSGRAPKISQPVIEEHEDMGMQKDSPVAELRAPQPGASEQPPRTMDRDDRRIIFAKLDEVYVGADHGYAAGWNDVRVANDLSCPRAWVEEVREDMFGPQKPEQAAEVVDLLNRLAGLEAANRTVVADAREARRLADEAATKASAILANANDLVARAEKIRADVRKLTGAK